MKPLAALFLAALTIGPATGAAHYMGWRIDALRPDSKEILGQPYHETLDYSEQRFELAADPPVYTVTLTDARKVLFSRRALHLDLCAHLLVGEHARLAQPPFTQFALFGTVSRRGPIHIELDRSKNELNPFMLLSIMSNQSDESIDPFVVERERVQERIVLQPDDSCTTLTQ